MSVGTTTSALTTISTNTFPVLGEILTFWSAPNDSRFMKVPCGVSTITYPDFGVKYSLANKFTYIGYAGVSSFYASFGAIALPWANVAILLPDYSAIGASGLEVVKPDGTSFNSGWSYRVGIDPNQAITWGTSPNWVVLGAQVYVSGGPYGYPYGIKVGSDVNTSGHGGTYFYNPDSSYNCFVAYDSTNAVWVMLCLAKAYTAPDNASGLNFTLVNNGGAPFVNSKGSSLIGGNGYFLAFVNGTVYRTASTSGYTWSSVNTTSLPSLGANLRFANGIYFALPTTSNANFFKSLDNGSTWSTIAVGGSGTVMDIIYANGYYLLVHSNGYIYKSSDLSSFTAVTNGSSYVCGIAQISGDYFLTSCSNSGAYSQVWNIQSSSQSVINVPGFYNDPTITVTSGNTTVVAGTLRTDKYVRVK